uniref:VWFA domain-containing protein n=1 Tax=Ascaris lumbricoides TaxID=6252 RepID=A0A9J2P808_ASCLU
MASKTTYAVGILGALIVALLIVCVGLLSAIFYNQKHPAETTQPQPQPQLAKNLVVLVDASTGVDNTLLGQEADFLNQQLRESLLAQSSGYTVRLAATAFASQLSSQLNYVDLNDANAVKALADAIRNGKRDEPLDLGKALSSLQSTLRAGPLGQQTLIVFASSQGENYANAVTEANSLKSDGTHIVAISLNSNGEDLSQFASSGSSLDGQAIKSGNTQGMQNLANRVGDIVAAQPPVILTTTTPSVQTQSTTTTTTTPQASSTTTTQPTTTTTTTPTPVNTKVLVLVDASSGITQEQMIKQTSFISTELMNSFLYPSEHGYKTEVLLVPYAFDTSPDNSEYILPDNLLSIDKQATSTKLARITTFVTPLDRLQIGQAFAEVERYDTKLTPTHIVVLASGQGDDYETAVTIAKRFANANIKVISVATVGGASDLSGITSDGVCALDGRDILEGKDLVSMANNIAKCIYPQSALPTKQKPKVIAQKVVSQKPKDKLVYVPPASGVKEVKVPVIEAEQPTSIDVVVLVDTSENAVNDKSISSQTTFIQSHLLKQLQSTFPDEQPRIVVIPYAFFLGAVAEEFAVIDTQNSSFLDAQLRRARVAPITSFMTPLDTYQLAPTLQLLAESYFVKSTRTKVLLLADDENPAEQVESAREYARNLTNSNKAVVVVSLTAKQNEYVQVFGASNVFDGSAIKSGPVTALDGLAQNVANAFKNYDKPSRTATTLLHIPARTRLSGRSVEKHRYERTTKSALIWEKSHICILCFRVFITNSCL